MSSENQAPEHFLLGGTLFEDISEHVAVHSAQAVSAFSAVLGTYSASELMRRFNPAKMNELNVYGSPWTQSGTAYVLHHLVKLPTFIAAASERRSGMLVVIC